MSISIEFRQKPNGAWVFSSDYSSVDAAKTACREMRRIGPHSYRDMDFRIYHNDTLFLVNEQTSSWRLRWIPGNGKSRAEQSA
jgi:hypothetical protein